ncbi:adenylate/guanylate cyclase domain-containing protein [Pseudorhodoplanes sp.]|uniref:adenylate/guanylate cyclase domain-containing protein n=1 Tax=Pseudorhodoplanes sp. TaxID=1934341 RepID=UPI003D1284DD
MSAPSLSDPVVAQDGALVPRLAGLGRLFRSYARLISGLVLMTFVLCHFTSHIFLIVSVPLAEEAFHLLMGFWLTGAGTMLLIAAFAFHVLNALWSIYIRRYLRMPMWEVAQLVLGLAIPPLIIIHVVGTRVSDQFFGTENSYLSVLAAHWLSAPWLGAPWLVTLQFAAVLTVWIHGCIGLHFWLRTRQWYAQWLPAFGTMAILIPALALAGYVAGGNQILREAQDPDFIQTVIREANFSAQVGARGWRVVEISLACYAGLVVLPFAARFIRGFFHRIHRRPRLNHVSGRSLRILPGATVLETLRANGVPHASVCGGRARCTTCRIRVVNGLATLPEPVGLEAAALSRIGASEGVRLACQLRPMADISVVPLLTADASAAHGLMRAGMEGSERQVTVVFIDLRGSTTLGEARMPYDVLFILNQFFDEMSKALAGTGGHYSNFTGDGLMAIYGLDSADPKASAMQALRGAQQMLLRLDKVNARLKADLKEPLRIGIGIHFGEAIVGAMGPPRSQIVTAIGDTVNTTARLEGLTKDHNCALILSQAAAQAAGIALPGETLHHAPVKGRLEPVAFYALNEVPELRK